MDRSTLEVFNLGSMTRTYTVETYGCQMNVHDSERIAGLLDEAGFITGNARRASRHCCL